MPDHAGARDFAKSANMRQAGGAITRFEGDPGLAGCRDPPDELARLLKRPGIGLLERGSKRWRGQRCGR